jgi:RNA polymerase sigma-70 factor (ECF subfamily)
MDTEAGAESELWTRSLRGESAAFGELFDKHRDRVFRHAFRLIGNVHDAEDAVAVVFLELWRRRNHVRVVDGSILPWLLVTTTNTCRNMTRAARRYRTFIEALSRDPDSLLAEEELLWHHPLDSVDSVDESLIVALRTLSPTDMQLFTLVNLEDYPISEAAAVLGVSTAAAKTRLHRSRVRLRAALGEPGELPPTLVTEPEGDPL